MEYVFFCEISVISLILHIKSFQSHTRDRVDKFLSKILLAWFSKNSNMLSALHLYLDEEWLHPIFCLIHPLNSVQPQPLLEMRVMMMMIAPVPLSSVQCCNILTSKARMAYNNNQLKPDHRRWHEMHQPFEIHLSPSLKTTSINIRVFKCNIDSFFAPETYNTNALMMKSMNS